MVFSNRQSKTHTHMDFTKACTIWRRRQRAHGRCLASWALPITLDHARCHPQRACGCRLRACLPVAILPLHLALLESDIPASSGHPDRATDRGGDNETRL